MKPGVKWPTFPYEEYRSRVERAQQCLDNHGLDAMLLFSPTNWLYYGGFTDAAQMHNDVWRSCLIVRRDSDPVAVVHAAFQWCIATMSYIEDVRVWSESDHFMVEMFPFSFNELFFDTLKDLGLADKMLGIETGPDINTYLGFDEYEALRKKLSDANIVSADKAIWDQRMIKTPFEQELIREGARRACECVRTAYETIRPGVNERDVHRAFWMKAAELDLIEAPYHGTWLCFSSNKDEVMGVDRWITGPVDRIIQEGDQGLCDCGPTYKGYQLDFQRTFYVGEPPEKMVRFHDVATEAHLETIATMKPGVRMCELFETSLEELRKRDYEMPHIISFIGHQEGLANHEPPWVTAEEKTPLQPGMVVAIEIGAFDPEREVFGGMPEDIILITEEGHENLTAHLPHNLWVAK
jgi:Xaa-Pro aminopeptidase